MATKYCREFIDFLNDDFKNGIIDGVGRQYFESLFETNYNISSYLRKAEETLAILNAGQVREKNSFIPPVGLGNPNSDLLIIGKNSTDDLPKLPIEYVNDNVSGTDYLQMLFLNETYLNFFSWKLLNDFGYEILQTNVELQNPEFPSSFLGLYNTEKPNTHKWYLINKLLQKKIGCDLEFKSNSVEGSFFKYVFLTDLDIRHSPNQVNQTNTQQIKQRFDFLLTNKFYSKFSTIIFANYNFLVDNLANLSEMIQDAYKVSPRRDFIPTKNIKGCFLSKNKKIFLTSQFSIGAGWKTSELLNVFV